MHPQPYYYLIYFFLFMILLFCVCQPNVEDMISMCFFAYMGVIKSVSHIQDLFQCCVNFSMIQWTISGHNDHVLTFSRSTVREINLLLHVIINLKLTSQNETSDYLTNIIALQRPTLQPAFRTVISFLQPDIRFILLSRGWQELFGWLWGGGYGDSEGFQYFSKLKLTKQKKINVNIPHHTNRILPPPLFSWRTGHDKMYVRQPEDTLAWWSGKLK